jgi:hypothetical protein
MDREVENQTKLTEETCLFIFPFCFALPYRLSCPTPPPAVIHSPILLIYIKIYTNASVFLQWRKKDTKKPPFGAFPEISILGLPLFNPQGARPLSGFLAAVPQIFFAYGGKPISIFAKTTTKIFGQKNFKRRLA